MRWLKAAVISISAIFVFSRKSSRLNHFLDHPTWLDVVGFVVHMGELLDSTIANHLDLRKTLAKSMAGQFRYYSVATAIATSSPSRTRRRT